MTASEPVSMPMAALARRRSEEHTSELQSRLHLVCRLLLEKKNEVDAGVGGRAAVEIGRRLARLARAHQVLVVTHLPQVAAFADQHLVVAKDTGGAVTTSGVTVVEDTERARELARMLAGLPDSDLGIAHAEELLAVAYREKSGNLA